MTEVVCLDFHRLTLFISLLPSKADVEKHCYFVFFNITGWTKVFLECVNQSETSSTSLIQTVSFQLGIFLVFPRSSTSPACLLGAVASLRRPICTNELLWGNKFPGALCLVLPHLLFAPVAGD